MDDEGQQPSSVLPRAHFDGGGVIAEVRLENVWGKLHVYTSSRMITPLHIARVQSFMGVARIKRLTPAPTPPPPPNLLLIPLPFLLSLPFSLPP